jgi:hypothetical protein
MCYLSYRSHVKRPCSYSNLSWSTSIITKYRRT